LLCGSLEELKPVDILSNRKKLDRTMYVYVSLYSGKVSEEYKTLADLCFTTGRGWGRDARLRTLSAPRRKTTVGGWQDEWDGLFDRPIDAEHEQRSIEAIKVSHDRLMRHFASEIGSVPGTRA
jgi:hypothetical protein